MQPSYQTIPRDTSEKIEPATHHNFGFKVDRRLTMIMAAVLFLLFVTTGYISNFLVTVQSDCLGPPYLYISHQDSHNILKYSRDGCPLSKNVLWFGNTADPAPVSIRSMAVRPYGEVKGALYIANAGRDLSDSGRILVFDNCAGLNNKRSYLKTLVDVRDVPGARHTYSLAFDGHGDVYASFQHTDAVLRFRGSTYEPVSPYTLPWFDDLYNKDYTSSPEPPVGGRRNYTIESDYFAGTFVQFGYPGIHDINTQGVRAIVWVEAMHQLWIANEDLHRIVIVNNNGQYVGKVKIRNPLGLLYDGKRRIVYVGSKKSNKDTGSVYGISIDTLNIVTRFTLLGGETMNHPTGLAVDADTLFVAEQSMNVVLTFNITTQRFIRQIIGPMANDGIESIILSDC